jgi:ABC-type branched-subunit amino acid transport system ATPase component
VLEARALTKRYGAFLALDRVDFHVRRGEILGYLGRIWSETPLMFEDEFPDQLLQLRL